MNILALETATDACSIALSLEGQYIEHTETCPQQHSQYLLLMIQGLLARTGIQLNQLDGIAFGQGPGSFTGVRIAAGAAHGLALALGCPIAPVSTLQSIAQNAYRNNPNQTTVYSALDARMQGLYWGQYALDETGCMQPQHPDQLTSIAEENQELSHLKGLPPTQCSGPGWALLGTPFNQADTTLLPSAVGIADIACKHWDTLKTTDFTQAEPIYLRHPIKK